MRRSVVRPLRNSSGTTPIGAAGKRRTIPAFDHPTVDAKVEDGFVTLTGAANGQYERDEAELVSPNIVAALDVFDEIELTFPTPNGGDVKESIRKAFKRNAALDADDLRISTDNGTVTVKGHGQRLAEHDEAIDAPPGRRRASLSARRPDGRVLRTRSGK